MYVSILYCDSCFCCHKHKLNYKKKKMKPRKRQKSQNLVLKKATTKKNSKKNTL